MKKQLTYIMNNSIISQDNISIFKEYMVTYGIRTLLKNNALNDNGFVVNYLYIKEVNKCLIKNYL